MTKNSATAIEACDVIIGNDEEFGLLAGSLEAGKTLAERIAQERPGRLVIYKMGGEGSVTFDGNAAFETPIYPVDMLKPFGAGDAFMGGVLASMVAGNSVAKAVDFGSAAAAMVVATRGCASAMPTTAQVLDFIQSHRR